MRKFLIVSLLSCFCLFGCKEHVVKIACIGDSITQGFGRDNQDSYPNQMNAMLGENKEVRNFGVGGRTMLKKGDFPLWKESAFTEALQYNADVAIILLGTNDSKPQNWDQYGNEFYSNYLSMIDTLKTTNPKMQIYVCYPPRAFAQVWGIRDSVIVNGVIPVVDSILTQRDVKLIDLHSAMYNNEDLFPDKIHPNKIGYKRMSEIVGEAISK
ncbi:GDSL-type esterase/lipase family protein [Labilibaculum euxinus]|uniref:Sialate O-acetylesterase n=1 Tax=Labilibaculum euxinus TaxID=2686357 RepID=A0A7M4D7J4_9BACT|nr:GDSL-type esterase/lipase family protein [Labilibaculum euxinus]MUP38623.1 sialate O-acetylesterase [Labilibaculum euxinus]MVB07828.1 sialate O-acetylesterase [Labilibaculum euxinus]